MGDWIADNDAFAAVVGILIAAGGWLLADGGYSRLRLKGTREALEVYDALHQHPGVFEGEEERLLEDVRRRVDAYHRRAGRLLVSVYYALTVLVVVAFVAVSQLDSKEHPTAWNSLMILIVAAGLSLSVVPVIAPKLNAQAAARARTATEQRSRAHAAAGEH